MQTVTTEATPAAMEESPLEFTGRGGEYFGIWIVNLLLTILTLGIYSAWAKVRRERYFHSHTRVAGSSFEYHGNPKSILKGRLIAFALLLTYNLSFKFSPAAGFAMMAVLALVFPFLFVSSLRFRLANTSYRGLRFSFAGSVKEGYLVFLLWPVVTGFTLYLLAPFAHHRIKRFQHQNVRYGTARTGFEARAWDFYKIYLTIAAVGLLILVLFGVAFGSTIFAAFQSSAQSNAALAASLVTFALLAVMALFFLLVMPFFRARIQNLVWNHTRLGDLRTVSRVQARKLFFIQLTNVLLIVCTLGLYKPFAQIRMTKYRIGQMALLAPPAGLDHFVAGETQAAAALGEEAAEMFDFDFGL